MFFTSKITIKCLCLGTFFLRADFQYFAIAIASKEIQGAAGLAQLLTMLSIFCRGLEFGS